MKPSWMDSIVPYYSMVVLAAFWGTVINHCIAYPLFLYIYPYGHIHFVLISALVLSLFLFLFPRLFELKLLKIKYSNGVPVALILFPVFIISNVILTFLYLIIFFGNSSFVFFILTTVSFFIASVILANCPLLKDKLSIFSLIKAKRNIYSQEVVCIYNNLISLAQNPVHSNYESLVEEYENKIAKYSNYDNTENGRTIKKLKQKYLSIKPTQAELELAKKQAKIKKEEQAKTAAKLKTQRLLKEKEVLILKQEIQTFLRAESECIEKIKTTQAKLKRLEKSKNKVNSADYITEEVKSKYLLQLNRSKELYTSYAENYASTFFRLHLAKIKKEINAICTAVYKDNKEIDGNKLARIKTDFEGVIKHSFNELSNKHKPEITEINRLITDLITLDNQEELDAELSEFLPSEDLTTTKGKELEDLLEKADLQSVETIDVILTELKESSSTFEKELARLEAENDVMEQFGE